MYKICLSALGELRCKRDNWTIAGQTLIAKKGTIASVDISGLSAGTYIAEATSADYQQKVLKFDK